MAQISIQDALKLARNAGFDPVQSVVMVAIWYRESLGLQTDIVNPTSGATGMAQIFLQVHPDVSPQQAKDPVFSANYSYKLFKQAGGSFVPWETYTVPADHPNSYLRALQLVTAVGRAIPDINNGWNDNELKAITQGQKIPPTDQSTAGEQGGGLTEGISNPLTSVSDFASSITKRLTDWHLWVRVLLVVVALILIYHAVQSISGTGPSITEIGGTAKKAGKVAAVA